MRKSAMRLCVPATCVSVLAAVLVCSGCGLVFGGSEAERFANKYWDERLTKCGDTRLAHTLLPNMPGISIIEFKGVSVWVNPAQLSEADKLNGFEWSGATGLSPTSWRYKPNAKSNMSAWVAGASWNGVRMWKKKGEDWQVERQRYGEYELHPDCELLK